MIKCIYRKTLQDEHCNKEADYIWIGKSYCAEHLKVRDSEWNKTFNLIDYKGKSDFIQDKEIENFDDIIVGEITKKEAIEQSEERLEDSEYYGIPAYIGKDEDLLEIYK